MPFFAQICDSKIGTKVARSNENNGHNIDESDAKSLSSNGSCCSPRATMTDDRSLVLPNSRSCNSPDRST